MGTSTQKESSNMSSSEADFEHSLILHNDEYNDFGFVVDTLIVVCEHEFEQAYQCALITHHKGKCEVKRGAFEILKMMKQNIIDRGINATIE